VSDIPFRTHNVHAIDRQTRKLIEDAERGAAAHGGDLNEFARQILAGRKQRERYFDPVLFSNPAWDILLNLFVAGADGRPVTVLDACIASTAPQSVAVRWLSYLKQEEMIMERTDSSIHRQTVICLSEHTRLAIASYLGSLTTIGLGPDPVRVPSQDRTTG
jgi:hypothetical protein